jgi:uncharacterized membrane protein
MQTEIVAHIKLHRLLLWMSVLAWGIGTGAQLFDRLVLVSAWSATPPQSLVFLPYGSHFPVSTGAFFLPISLATLVGAIGALVTGWKTSTAYRLWLWLSAVLILAIFALTIVVMLPMNAALFVADPGATLTPTANPDVVQIVQRWVFYDWIRIAMLAVGFVSAVHSISLRLPLEQPRSNIRLAATSAYEAAENRTGRKEEART